MSVNPTDAAAHQAVALDKRQHLLMSSERHTWQAFKQRQYFRPAAQGTARQFPNDKRVAFHFVPAQQGLEGGITPPEMVHPD